MKVSALTKSALAVRRETRDMKAAGWEYVEGGGKLWELHRGWRYNHRIVDVKIAAGGKSLWVKVAPQAEEDAALKEHEGAKG